MVKPRTSTATIKKIGSNGDTVRGAGAAAVLSNCWGTDTILPGRYALAEDMQNAGLTAHQNARLKKF